MSFVKPDEKKFTDLELKEDVGKITKEELRKFYDDLEEKGDPYFFLLPFPDFMVKENPAKYGWTDDKDSTENIFNGIEYEELLRQGKEEEAKEFRENFIKKLQEKNKLKLKPNAYVPKLGSKFDL